MVQSGNKLVNTVLKEFLEKIQIITGINLINSLTHTSQREQGRQLESIFIFFALENNHEQEFIIDIEIDLEARTAILYHIALPLNMRQKGMGTRIVVEIEKTLLKLGLNYISLPAEHHSTGFWLKSGYWFKHNSEDQFYQTNAHRENLRVAYELEKVLNAFIEDNSVLC